MNKIIAVFLVAGLVAGCESSPRDMQCGAYGVRTSFEGDNISAVINGDAVVLTRAIAASGERYAGVLNDTDVSLWGHGGEWFLILGDDAPIKCAQ